jgi:hypothetical protein
MKMLTFIRNLHIPPKSKAVLDATKQLQIVRFFVVLEDADGLPASVGGKCVVDLGTRQKQWL